VANDPTPPPGTDKPWWQSVIIWAGVIQTFIAILDFLPTQEAIPEGWHKYIALVAGVLTILARGFRPNDPIARRLLLWLVGIGAALAVAFGSVAACWAETKVLPPPGQFAGVVISTEPGKWFALSAAFEPTTVDVRDGGKVCIIVGPAGKYAAVRTPPGDGQQEVHVLTLGAAGPVPKPDDKPQPKPKPDDPVPSPAEDKLGFVQLSRDQATKIAPPAEKAKAAAVADNFEGVAGGLAAGRFQAATPAKTIELAQEAIVVANRATIGGVGTAGREAWLPFFTAWKVKADTLVPAGKLIRPEDYVQAYTETAAGLRLVNPGERNRVGP
jgi:hypothetical protein